MFFYGKWTGDEWAKALAADGLYTIAGDKPRVLDRIVKEVDAIFPNNAAHILVPGCGITGHVEKHLAEQRIHNDTIVCTDFAPVIALAPQTHSEKITYEAHDSRTLPFENKFDVVIPVNAVVSGYHQDNMIMLKNFRRALKPGGTMAGFFPTADSVFDMYVHSASNDTEKTAKDLAILIDFIKPRPNGSDNPIYYTISAMYNYLIEAGFDQNTIDIGTVRMDTPGLKEQAKRHHQLSEKSPPIYEMFVKAQKPVTH